MIEFRVRVLSVSPETGLVELSTDERVSLDQLRRRRDVPNRIVRRAYEAAVREAEERMRYANHLRTDELAAWVTELGCSGEVKDLVLIALEATPGTHAAMKANYDFECACGARDVADQVIERALALFPDRAHPERRVQKAG